MKKKTLKELDAHNDEMAVLSSAERFNRARSITVGTCFNGVTEIMVRGDGKFLWAPMRPVEVVELIHQLAANIGCHIHIQPRNDFASWRAWRENSNAQPFIAPGLSHPPYPNHPPSLGEENNPSLRSNQNEQTVATQKTVGRKRTKRAATAA